MGPLHSLSTGCSTMAGRTPLLQTHKLALKFSLLLSFRWEDYCIVIGQSLRKEIELRLVAPQHRVPVPACNQPSISLLYQIQLLQQITRLPGVHLESGKFLSSDSSAAAHLHERRLKTNV